MIDPAFFGCSSKLPYAETAALRKGEILGDFSKLADDSNIILSIDRVNRCSRDWDTFADIAINHVTADVEVGGATALHILIAFEFGPDAESEQDRATASMAFQDAADRRAIVVGKRHSAIGYGPTAATIAVLGKRPNAYPLKPFPDKGDVFISRPLGFFKMHYMLEMGTSQDERFTALLRVPPAPCDRPRNLSLGD